MDFETGSKNRAGSKAGKKPGEAVEVGLTDVNVIGDTNYDDQLNHRDKGRVDNTVIMEAVLSCHNVERDGSTWLHNVLLSVEYAEVDHHLVSHGDEVFAAQRLGESVCQH